MNARAPPFACTWIDRIASSGLEDARLSRKRKRERGKSLQRVMRSAPAIFRDALPLSLWTWCDMCKLPNCGLGVICKLLNKCGSTGSDRGSDVLVWPKSRQKPAPCTGSPISSPAVPPLPLIDANQAWIVDTRAPAVRCCVSQGLESWILCLTHGCIVALTAKWGKTT